MEVVLKDTLPAKDQYYALFETTGWNREYKAAPDEIMLAVMNSQITTSAYDGEKLVGFGRVVTDGVLHAMIYDMIVLPSYRKQGIGRLILNTLVARCRDASIRDIQLFCAANQREFYEKNGFEARPSNAPGMQYRRQP
jgi:GNAT superfamily N-acetyltransferase